MSTETLLNLKIHKIPEEEFESSLEAGSLDANALYLTPDDGIAKEAERLTIETVGDADTPVYFSAGKPVACKTVDASALINTLSEGNSDPQDADFYVSQYAGGGATTTTYHRRPHSALWNYIQGKIKSVLGLDKDSYGGNVDAEHVYFRNDITVTTDVGNVKIDKSTGTGTIPAKDKNVKQVFEELWSTDKIPGQDATITMPFITISGSSSYHEIGTTINPSISATFNSGSYPFEPKETGVKVNKWTTTFKGSTTDKASTDNNFTKSFDSFVIDENTYSITVTASYDASTVTPKSALGKEYPDKKISANTTPDKSKSYIGYKPNFYGFKSTAIDINSIESAAVRGLDYIQTGSNTTPVSSATCNSAWMQFFYAVPKGRKTSLSVKDSNNLPLTVSTKEVTVKHEGTTTSKYTVFYINNASAYSATTLTLKWS